MGTYKSHWKGRTACNVYSVVK